MEVLLESGGEHVALVRTSRLEARSPQHAAEGPASCMLVT
jgi:hypothetical protein